MADEPMSGARERLWLSRLMLLAGATMVSGHIACAQPANSRPEDTTLPVSAPAGQGMLPALVSADWSRAQPSVVRTVVIVHDVLRDAEQALRMVQQAGARAEVAPDTMLVVAPRFGDEADVVAHRTTRRNSAMGNGQVAKRQFGARAGTDIIIQRHGCNSEPARGCNAVSRIATGRGGGTRRWCPVRFSAMPRSGRTRQH